MQRCSNSRTQTINRFLGLYGWYLAASAFCLALYRFTCGLEAGFGVKPSPSPLCVQDAARCAGDEHIKYREVQCFAARQSSLTAILLRLTVFTIQPVTITSDTDLLTYTTLPCISVAITCDVVTCQHSQVGHFTFWFSVSLRLLWLK